MFTLHSDPDDPQEKRQLINYNVLPFSLPDSVQPFQILQIDDIGGPVRIERFCTRESMPNASSI